VTIANIRCSHQSRNRKQKKNILVFVTLHLIFFLSFICSPSTPPYLNDGIQDIFFDLVFSHFCLSHIKLRHEWNGLLMLLFFPPLFVCLLMFHHLTVTPLWIVYLMFDVGVSFPGMCEEEEQPNHPWVPFTW